MPIPSIHQTAFSKSSIRLLPGTHIQISLFRYYHRKIILSPKMGFIYLQNSFSLWNGVNKWMKLAMNSEYVHLELLKTTNELSRFRQLTLYRHTIFQNHHTIFPNAQNLWINKLIQFHCVAKLFCWSIYQTWVSLSKVIQCFVLIIVEWTSSSNVWKPVPSLFYSLPRAFQTIVRTATCLPNQLIQGRCRHHAR